MNVIKLLPRVLMPVFAGQNHSIAILSVTP